MKSFGCTAKVIGVFLLASSTAYSQVDINASYSLSGDDPDGSPGAFGDAYGAAAAIWEDWLFIGAPRETAFRDGDDYQDGAVYIYRNVAGTYVFQQKLTMPGSSDPLDFDGFLLPVGDRFGGGVDAAGGWLFVGAANDQDFPGVNDPREDVNLNDPAFHFAGQVHIYRLNGSSWDFVQTLTAPVPKSQGSFGTRSQASHIALATNAKVAIIGELYNFDGEIGEAHVFRRNKSDAWEYAATIVSPDPDLTFFADEVVNVGGKKYLIGGTRFSGDGTEIQGSVYVYDVKVKKASVDLSLLQTIAGPVYDPVDCGAGSSSSFGTAGVDAGSDVVAIADPCYSGVAGASSGRVNIYRLVPGATPLSFETTIEGDQAQIFFGSNDFGSQHAVAVSQSGNRILISASKDPIGFIGVGTNVRVYAFEGGAWINESNLLTPTPPSATFRGFGDTVFFTDDETALVRENNFIDPVVSGRKGQGFFYGLTP